MQLAVIRSSILYILLPHDIHTILSLFHCDVNALKLYILVSTLQQCDELRSS